MASDHHDVEYDYDDKDERECVVHRSIIISSSSSSSHNDVNNYGDDESDKEKEAKHQYKWTEEHQKKSPSYDTVGMMRTIALLLLLLSVYACALQYSLVSDVIHEAEQKRLFLRKEIILLRSNTSSYRISSARQLTSIQMFGISIQSSPVSYFNEMLKPSERRRITLHI
jgi:hypothetical protein